MMKFVNLSSEEFDQFTSENFHIIHNQVYILITVIK